MENWLMWALGIVSNAVLGALAFFLKRSLQQMDRLEQRVNELLRDLPAAYVEKSAWRAMEAKLDRVTELLLRPGVCIPSRNEGGAHDRNLQA